MSSRSKTRFFTILIFIAAIAAGFFVMPQVSAKFGISLPTQIIFPFRLGLDLQGGTHLVYRADLSNISTPERSSAMESLRDVIERRVNIFGVAEPIVQVEKSASENRLIVELAGVKNISEAIRMIGETPFLEFREERPEEESKKIIEAVKSGETILEDPYFIPTNLTGQYLKRAVLDFDNTTFEPQISLEFNNEGAEIFADLTQKNVGKKLAIYLDGLPISAPVVREEIKEGRAQITGQFTPEEAKTFVGRLNAGALPVPITLISRQSVGASLGQESLEKSLMVGLYGFLAVAIFMIIWYRLPGLIAVIALLIYTVLTLSIFKLIPVTLTVAGIAGFILSVGMAVDANILIFERMKEELLSGKSLGEATKEGFSRAWTSIRDSNISSLITASILYWFGTSMVRGFALTLGIGILISMFSAITITRGMLVSILTPRLEKVRALFLSGFSRQNPNVKIQNPNKSQNPQI